MNTLPKRDVPALIEALRIRALALTGEKWERTATRDMMKEAADQLERAEATLAAIRAGMSLVEEALDEPIGEQISVWGSHLAGRIRGVLTLLDATPKETP